MLSVVESVNRLITKKRRKSKRKKVSKLGRQTQRDRSLMEERLQRPNNVDKFGEVPCPDLVPGRYHLYNIQCENSL